MKVAYVPGPGRSPGWTVSEERVAEAIGFVPTLSCFPGAWEAPPPSLATGEEQRQVEIESVAFGQRFVARADAHQDENWLRQLLSPAFVDWLTTGAHDEFGFELHEGTLRCFRTGPLDEAATATFRSEAATVAQRVRAEVEESEGLGVRELGSGVSERVERAVAKVRFPSPPADARTAARPFRAVAARDPRVYVAALGGVVSAFTLLLYLLFEIGVDAVDLVIEVVGWLGPDNTAIALGVLALAGWLAALPEAISIASRPYGRLAFAREYAAARHLRLESPHSFHRRLMRVELPSPAQFVLAGPLGRERRPGRLVLCRTRTRLFHSYHDAVVLHAPDLDAHPTPDDQGWRLDDSHLVFFRAAEADRSAASLDRFVADALALRARLAAGSAGQIDVSSTSPSGS